MIENRLDDLIEKGNDWVGFIRYLDEKIEELEKRIEHLEFSIKEKEDRR